MNTYLKGDGQTRVVRHRPFRHGHASQRHHLSFHARPGISGGLGFVQIYFGVPLALIIIAAVFLPIYRRLNVYTAYEFLGQRFDTKTRLLGAALFLLQRGLGAGITIYAPAIVLSTVFGWRLDLTIICSGLLVIIYTVTGGSEAVTLTQKYQMAIIFAGMVTAFCLLIAKLPAGLDFSDALHVAGGFHKLQAVNFSLDVHERYTFWSGLLGGTFLIAFLFRHRSIAGAALHFRRLVARKPARPDVQRRLQNPDAVLHPAARRADFCLLSIRTAAGVF